MQNKFFCDVITSVLYCIIVWCIYCHTLDERVGLRVHFVQNMYRIVSNKRPRGVAIFQKGDVYKRQLFNAKMQCLSLFTLTRHREIWAFYLVLFENKLGGRLLEGERLLETIRYSENRVIEWYI